MRTKKKRMIVWLQIAAILATTLFGSMPVQAAAGETGQKADQETRFGEEGAARQELSFNDDWRFFLEESESVFAAGKDFDDTAWRRVDLPHDYSIEQDFDPNSPAGANGGYLNGGVGWYRKTFTLPESMAGKKISIQFGGIYMDSSTYVNGTLIGTYPYGYSPFAYDITDYVVADGVTENVIVVKVNHQQPSSRWYSGSGIYRNVTLVVSEDVHVKRYGTFVTTPDLEALYAQDKAEAAVRTTIVNDRSESVKVSVTSAVYDSEGNLFAGPVSTQEKVIAAGETTDYEQSMSTPKPMLWSVDSPNLYQLTTEVTENGKIVDTYQTTFGFRWITMDPNEGFFLNGKYMKLNGMCMHHDQGALGAVANYRAIERQMEIMKSMGVNAIRVTHNPAADELLEICNKLGLMVIDEAFDCWESAKRSKDYARFFSQPATHPDAKEGQTWAEFDIKNMVDRGKNDPCIIMWSIGNEIVNASVPTAKKLVQWVAEIDPTRPATEGFNNFIGGFWDNGMKQVADVTGVVGFNYGEDSYDAAHAEYPDWIIMGSETSSAVRSRGYYSVDDQNKIRSCYDDGNTVGWGRSAEAAWKANRDRKFVMGEFVWTGFDYIGEPSPYHDMYPAKSSYFGAVDTAGIPKDAYYIYQSQWTTADENPMVHLLPHWNWENDNSIKDSEGKIKVQAYSNAARVELFLNGESLGEKSFEQKKTSDGRSYQEAADGHIYLEWKTAYEPGELKAVAKDTEGNIIAEDIIRTAGQANQIRLTPDREVITADGQDLSYILAEVVDQNGTVVPTANNNIKFQISGNGKIVGVDNGDATEVTQSYKGNERKAYSGKAIVIVQSTKDAGSFTLSASSGGLRSDSAKVFTAVSQDESQLLGYEDAASVYVKKGETPKFPDSIAAVYGNGKKEEKAVVWEGLSQDELEEAGLYKVRGVVSDTQDRVEIDVIVMDYIGILPLHVVTAQGVIPVLPNMITAVYNTGEEEKLPVSWEEIKPEQVEKTGSFTVKGKAGSKEVTAVVRVAESTLKDGRNIAVRSGTYPIPTASWVQPNGNDPVSAINNGNVVYNGGAAGERWIAWGHGVTDEWVQLEFENPIETGKVGLDFWNNASDSAMAMPDRVTITYSLDGEEWKNVQNQNISELKDLKTNEENFITFDTITAKYIRWNLYNEKKLAAGISEVHVYEKEIQVDAGETAELETIQINGKEIEGFSPEQDFYAIEQNYGEPLPQITAWAKDENAVVFLVPALSSNSAASIRVISEDGKTQKTYTIQFYEKAPVLDQAEIQIARQPLTEDDVEIIELTAKLQDGTILSEGVLDISFTLGNPEIAEVRNGQLYAVKAGSTTLQATVAYQGIIVESNVLDLEILPNTAVKTITGYEQISVVTAKGEEPELPEKIRATFDIGLPKAVAVTWDEITPNLYEAYGTFTVEGSVEGQTLRPQARVTVKGITGVQQFSCAVPVGVVPKLPEKARVYYSDGSIDELAVVWRAHPQSLFGKAGKTVNVRGSVTDEKGDGSVHPVTVSVRVTEDTVNGDKFTGYKNGFYWPLGIASFTNGQGSSGDTAAKLNDNIISHENSGNNRWCNWTGTARKEDWAGIIFGLEEVTYKFIDNLEVDFYTDHGANLPPEYVIEYYDGPYFNTPPADPDNVGADHPAGVEEYWKPVTGLKAPEQLSDSQTNYFSFDTVETCAIRIRMQADEGKCLAITEMGAYEKLAVTHTEPVITELYADNVKVPGFETEKTDYVYSVHGARMPEITAKGQNNTSVSVIYPQTADGTIQVIARAEDGVAVKTYRIQLEAGMSLDEIIQKAEEAQKAAEKAKQEAQEAQEAAKKANEEAEAARKKAEEAQEKAEAAQKEAEKAQERAEAAQKEAEKAKEEMEAARKEAEKAKEEAEAARKEVQKKEAEAKAAQEEAIKAKKEAEEIRKKAEEAVKEAEARYAEAEKIRAEAEGKNMSPVSVKSAVSKKKKQIKVTWKKMKNADGYELQYAANKSFKKAVKKTISSKKTSYVIKNVKSQKKYYVRIRAYCNINGQKTYGPYSKKKSVQVK